jgi:hypothetical protein
MGKMTLLLINRGDNITVEVQHSNQKFGQGMPGESRRTNGKRLVSIPYFRGGRNISVPVAALKSRAQGTWRSAAK